MSEEVVQKLEKKAICLSLNISVLGNVKKLDKEEYTVEADKDMTNATKKLLDSPELKAVSKLDGGLRNLIYSLSLPSLFKQGVYLIPLQLVEEVNDVLKDFEAKRQDLVDKFVLGYERLISEARVKLGAVFNPNDYKTIEQVRKAFSLSWMYVSMGTPLSLQDVSMEAFEQEKIKAATLWQETLYEAQKILRVQLSCLVDNMLESLTSVKGNGKPKTFQDTLITNMGKWLQLFDARNLADDAALKEVVDKAKVLLSGIDPQALRESGNFRNKVVEEFGKVSEQLSTLVKDKPKRTIRFEEDE